MSPSRPHPRRSSDHGFCCWKTPQEGIWQYRTLALSTEECAPSEAVTGRTIRIRPGPRIRLSLHSDKWAPERHLGRCRIGQPFLSSHRYASSSGDGVAHVLQRDAKSVDKELALGKDLNEESRDTPFEREQGPELFQA